MTGTRIPARAVLAEQPLVRFVQNDRPGLAGGEYTVRVRQETNQPPPDTFTASRRFAVAAERFGLDPAELAAVFPPELAVGDLANALPHVLIGKRTLPWQRRSVPDDASAPWLAVLLFDEEHAPVPTARTAKDLIPLDTPITAAGSSVTGTGAMPDGFISYPSINPLDYGQSPDDPCMTIDVDPALFSAVAPSAADLPFLAHIRDTDTVDGRDSDAAVASFAVVLGNRVPREGTTAHAYLVSLENMGPLLPDDAGRAAAGLAGAGAVRLLTYRWWSFTPATADAAFLSLLKDVNAGPGALTTLQLPYPGPRPDAGQVQRAMGHQAAGNLTDADAATLSHNAFGMGYVPVVHRLRHGGRTLSWYRGPLAPFPVTVTLQTPISGPDAATRYNPQTGMFDVSYAAAWQLGRLLALGSGTFTVALCNWRRGLRVDAVVRAEQERYENLLGGAFESVLGPRASRLAPASEPPPDAVVGWLARLALLHGVPFSYLVPDERMLPPESLRMFHLDHAWIEALVDGAFSIGRGIADDVALDAAYAPAVRTLAYAARRHVRRNPEPAGRRDADGTGEITGFLLRSAAVSGWPDATVIGYADERETGVPPLRSALLGTDVMLCLFDGVVRVVAIREPPGQLHCGAQGKPGHLVTALREVTGPRPGQPYDPPREAAVPARGDGRTVQAAAAAENIATAVGLTAITSAEFALEIVKGVEEVVFRQTR